LKAAGGALAPQVVAEAIGNAYRQPADMTIREIVLRATGQEA
jgi:NADP-dependent 3-hydroxy acid dehydrogenase YdfG